MVTPRELQEMQLIRLKPLLRHIELYLYESDGFESVTIDCYQLLDKLDDWYRENEDSNLGDSLGICIGCVLPPKIMNTVRSYFYAHGWECDHSFDVDEDGYGGASYYDEENDIVYGSNQILIFSPRS
jgi:hypothetical protein